MIVSVTLSDNREAEVAGALKSVVNDVDRVLVVDTGITDKSIERARTVAGKKLVVRRHAWVDFAAARNFGLDEAAALGADWVLIVDTDERLDFGGLHLARALKTAKVDALYVQAADNNYSKEKLVRASAVPYVRYVGTTHEYLRGGSRETLSGAIFYELVKPDNVVMTKCARDIRILTGHLENHPEDPDSARWWYYLGQSWTVLASHERAAEAYGKSVELGKVGEQTAWAAYCRAEALSKLGRYYDAVRVAAAGLAANPGSPECAYAAAVASYGLGRQDHAAAWARISIALGGYSGVSRPEQRAGLRNPAAFYELPYEVLSKVLPDEAERAQAALHCRAAKLARVGARGEADLDRMGVIADVPPYYREEAREMLRPPKLVESCPSFQTQQIDFQPERGYRPTNPSLARHRGEIWCVVRAVNYSMQGTEYTIDDPDGVVRTDNYLGRLRGNKILGARLMRDLDQGERFPAHVTGYEDVRLVSLGGKSLTASATVCDRDPDKRRLIARLHLSAEGDIKKAEVQPSNQLCEKNWMPLDVGGRLRWIYSLDPTAILPGPLHDCPLRLEHLRGGAAIELRGGYTCVVHEAINTADGRVYLHRFVRLDDAFHVTGVSPAWIFGHYGVEFCAGLVYDAGQLVLSYGVGDRQAWVARVSADEVAQMKWIVPEAPEHAAAAG